MLYFLLKNITMDIFRPRKWFRYWLNISKKLTRATFNRIIVDSNMFNLKKLLFSWYSTMNFRGQWMLRQNIELFFAACVLISQFLLLYVYLLCSSQKANHDIFFFLYKHSTPLLGPHNLWSTHKPNQSEAPFEAIISLPFLY